jgi:hypothetical protein
MKRRTPLLTALAIAGVAAVIGGLAATAFGPEDGPAVKPSGEETRIRIEPQKDRVACSGDKQAVDVFLDDLQGGAGGLAAFQLTLLYDPSILRVEKPEDAQMNPALASAQTAGEMRAFMPAPTTIDNLEGYVLFGAIGIPQGEPFDPTAAGIDPVARGEPILLFTVNFQTVGEGASPLAVYSKEEAAAKVGVVEDKFMEWGGREYTPLVIEEASLTVTAGDCAPASAVTPRPTQALPKWYATVTPGAAPTPQVVVPTPQVVTPVPAAEGGRPDCPQGWTAYNDPDGHFSTCYPSGWFAANSRASPESGLGLSVSNFDPGETKGPANPIFITLVWRPPVERPYLEASHCSQFEGVWGVPVEKFTLEVGGVQAEGCKALGNSMNVDEGSFELLVPTHDGGVIQVFVGRAGPDIVAAEASVLQILGTVQIPEQ